MDPVLKEIAVKEQVAERELRAKVATDAAEENLEQAPKLLRHAAAKLPRKWYMPKPESVPLNSAEPFL